MVLVAAPRKGSPDARHVTEHLEELTRLVDTAGAEVVGRISQHIVAPNPATLIGEGKVEEVAGEVATADASLVIFDEELSPVQGVNLERELKVRVMDRAEVILVSSPPAPGAMRPSCRSSWPSSSTCFRD